MNLKCSHTTAAVQATSPQLRVGKSCGKSQAKALLSTEFVGVTDGLWLCQHRPSYTLITSGVAYNKLEYQYLSTSRNMRLAMLREDVLASSKYKDPQRQETYQPEWILPRSRYSQIGHCSQKSFWTDPTKWLVQKQSIATAVQCTVVYI